MASGAKTTKIKFDVEVTVDPEAYKTAYGVSDEEVSFDLAQYVQGLIQDGCADDSGIKSARVTEAS